MDIRDFKAGSYKKGYKYHYFLPEKINYFFFETTGYQRNRVFMFDEYVRMF